MARLLGLPVLLSPYILTADGQPAFDPENGHAQFDSEEQKAAFDRVLLRDEERLVMWRKELRAMRRYRLELERVRSELQSNLELLRSKLDEQ